MKKILRTLFLVMVAIIIVGISGIQVANAATISGAEDFESYNVGDYPSTFTMLEDGSAASMQVVLLQSAGNNYFHIFSDHGTVSSHRASVAGTEFKTQTLDFACTVTPGIGDSPFNMDVYTEGGLARIYFNSGEIRYFDTGATYQVLGSYASNTSYAISVYMDTVNDTIDIILDGTTVIDDGPLLEASGEGTGLLIHNVSSGGVPAVGYIDNIFVMLNGEYAVVSNPQTGEQSWLKDLGDWFASVFK